MCDFVNKSISVLRNLSRENFCVPERRLENRNGSKYQCCQLVLIYKKKKDNLQNSEKVDFTEFLLWNPWDWEWHQKLFLDFYVHSSKMATSKTRQKLATLTNTYYYLLQNCIYNLDFQSAESTNFIVKRKVRLEFHYVKSQRKVPFICEKIEVSFLLIN